MDETRVILTLTIGLPVAALVYWTVSSLVSFISNCQKARIIGLPATYLPVYEVNLLYKITLPLHEPLIKLLRLDSWSKYWELFYGDWQFKFRYDVFREHGSDLILTVAPRYNVVTVADAEVAYQLTNSRTDFEKPTQLYSRIDFMGPNIVSADGHNWRRYRKICSPAFSEDMMSIVWAATKDLSLSLCSKWEMDAVIPDTKHDLFTFFLSALSAAVFDVPMPFNHKASSGNAPKDPSDDEYFTSIPAGYHFTFFNAVSNLLDNIVAVAAAPVWLLRLGPKGLKETATAFDNSRNYFSALLAREKSRESSKRSFLRCLIDPPGQQALTEDEAIGNTLVMAIAGHETSSMAVMYALLLLAIFPEKQQWFLEQLDKELDGQPENPTEWEYRSLFPRLVVALCVMNETLRLFPPIAVIPKWTGDKSATIHQGSSTYHIPPETMFSISLPGLHHNPKYWGPDATAFRPEKWHMEHSEGWTPETSTPVNEDTQMPFRNLRKPVPGAYMPFADGHRTCLGKRFAQVEFVLLLAVLFRRHRIEVVRLEAETEEEAKERVWKIMRESSSLLTLQMQAAVPVRLVGR